MEFPVIHSGFQLLLKVGDRLAILSYTVLGL